MKNFLKNSLIASVGLFAPVLAFAQTGGNANTSAGAGLARIVADAQTVIGMLVPMMIGLAVVGFAWGIIKYLFGSDKEGAKKVMLWGIIAIFVLSSIWGIVGVLQQTLIGNSGSANGNNYNATVPTIR